MVEGGTRRRSGSMHHPAHVNLQPEGSTGLEGSTVAFLVPVVAFKVLTVRVDGKSGSGASCSAASDGTL